jgi:hypothetical protein
MIKNDEKKAIMLNQKLKLKCKLAEVMLDFYNSTLEFSSLNTQDVYVVILTALEGLLVDSWLFVAALCPEDADVWYDSCLKRIKLLLEVRKKTLSDFGLDKLEALVCPKCKKNLVPEIHTNEKGEKVIILKCKCGYERELSPKGV